VYGRGAQRVTPAGKGAVLEADLGRLNTIQVRWRQEKIPPPTDSLQVHEIYLWDLRSSASMLRGVLQYTTTQGAPTTLSIALPENMEVSQVRCGPARDSAAVPRLKKWLVSGTKNERLLRLEFQTPIANSVQVYVELVSSL